MRASAWHVPRLALGLAVLLAATQARAQVDDELSPAERDEVRARAWQYLDVFDYKSFI